MPSLSEAASSRPGTPAELSSDVVAAVGRIPFLLLLAQEAGEPLDDRWTKPPTIGLLDYTPMEAQPSPPAPDQVGYRYTAER